MATQTQTKENPTAHTPPNASDRCDNADCNAAARFVAVLGEGNTLMFCLHHGNFHEANLEKLSATIHKYPY